MFADGLGLLTWTLRGLGTDLTDTVVTRRAHTLVTHGPYRWVRHPFCDALALLIVAMALIAANWFILATGVVVTDSDETIRRRSLIAYFPELLTIELARYPTLEALHQHAAAAGLRMLADEPASGSIPLTDDLIARLAAKFSSAMRLMRPEDHAAGMERARAGQAKGEQWLSCYAVLYYGRGDAENG